jgi:nicotinamide-nucleotide amidase
MRWLWERHLEAALTALVPADVRRHECTFRTVGIAESALGERLQVVEEQVDCEVRYAVEEQRGTIQVTLLQSGPDRLAELRDQARDLVGEHLCAEGEETLAEALVRRLVEAHASVATAESCTGGRVASALTGVSGVSAVFLEGVVSYSNQAKIRLLDVPAELIEAHGAVSEPVARAMAEGVRARADAELGVATTGIAGPGGGTDAKPVGTVHFAVARRGGETLHLHRVVPGSRHLVQCRSTALALDLLRKAL